MAVELGPVDSIEVTRDGGGNPGNRGETAFRELLNDESLTFQRVSIPPGKDEDAHYHDADTYIYHLQGEVRVTFEGKQGEERVKVLSAGDMLKIPAGVIHQPSSISDVSVETVAIRLGTDVETTYV